MSTALFHSLQTNIWSIFLIVLFFGGSIFVHELGHFLAARARGVLVEQFSIGFGPALFSWKGKDGVEYRLGCLPLGGYVLLPQLADLSALEGEAKSDVKKLPEVGYLSKVIVFCAGAFFNVVFAFLLACIISLIGQRENLETLSTKIGYITPTLETTDHAQPVPSPALEAHLLPGDVVKAIDGTPISNWNGLMHALLTGSGRAPDGRPQTVFTIERDGVVKDYTLYPVLSKEDKNRQIGIRPGYDLIIHSVEAGSAAEKGGLRADDQVVSVNGKPQFDRYAFFEEIVNTPAEPVALVVLRAGSKVALTIPPRLLKHEDGGIVFTVGTRLTHPSPFAQVAEAFTNTFADLSALLNHRSDVGLSKMSGPVGIVHIFREAAEVGIRAVLAMTILINVNLAMINLLPLPVLDGGHILFATIGRLRGRALPVQLILAAQSVFLVLILTAIIYLSVFDVRRWARDAALDQEAETAAAAAQHQAAAPAPAPAAAKP